MTRLAGKAALVTGGGKGIGRAIVQRLLDDGATVLACARSPRPGDFPDAVGWQQCDVSDSEAVAGLANAAPELDILVNNAGVQVEKTVVDSTDADWDLVMGANARGVFNMCRAFIPQMRAGGSIVNIGSISGNTADPSMALYNASKAFVHGLTRSVAVDHGPEIRCNAVCPGWIMTAMAEDAFALAADPVAAQADALNRHPAGRFGQPEDIAAMVAYLASDDARFLTGACLTVDGGMTAASPLQPGLF